MLRAILNKSWRQHPTKQQLYDHLRLFTKTIRLRRTRHAGHSWRSKDELISDVLLWTPSHGHAKAGRPARTYIQQLCEDAECSPGDLPEAMNDRVEWWERVRDIRTDGATRWWWFREVIFVAFIIMFRSAYFLASISCIRRLWYIVDHLSLFKKISSIKTGTPFLLINPHSINERFSFDGTKIYWRKYHCNTLKNATDFHSSSDRR